MKRDGALKSLWQEGTEEYAQQGTGTADAVFDVLVAGGGITGITTALLLQQAGKRVVVAEAHSLCFGTTAGTTAHINSFLDTSYDMIESDFGEEAARQIANATRQSKALFEKHIADYGIDCGYYTADGFVYAQDEKQEKQLQKMHDAAKKAGADVDYTPETAVPIGFTKAIVYRGQAGIHAARYVMALAKAFEEAGGIILQNAAVDAFEKTTACCTWTQPRAP